jgi:predicted DNA-binding transcriptional regulator AlpA
MPTHAEPAVARRPADLTSEPAPPGLLRRRDAARFCSVGASTWDRWTAAGLNPAPVKIGGAVAWSRDELAEWQRHGCPSRKTWAPLWARLRDARRR